MSKKVRIKPGRTQSMVGFAAGILFCFIGIFVIIPVFGLFGIVWTLMAVIITITNAVNAFTDKGVTSHEIIIDDGDERNEKLSAGCATVEMGKTSENASDENASDGNAAGLSADELKESIESRLRAAEELYNARMITETEYEEKRKEILKDL